MPVQRQPVLPAIARPAVGPAAQGQAGFTDQPEDIVTRRADLQRVVSCLGERGNDPFVRGQMIAGVEERQIRAARRNADRPPFELIERFEAEIVVDRSFRDHHAGRLVDLVERAARTAKVVDVRRIVEVQAALRRKARFAPDQPLTADRDIDQPVVDIERVLDIGVEQLRAVADLVEGVDVALVADHLPRRRARRDDLVRVEFAQRRVDVVVEQQHARFELQIVAADLEPRGPFDRRSDEIALVVVQVAFVVDRVSRTRRGQIARVRAGLVGTDRQALVGRAQVRIQVRLANQIRVARLDADRRAERHPVVPVECQIVDPAVGLSGQRQQAPREQQAPARDGHIR